MIAGGAGYSAGFAGTWAGVDGNRWKNWETGENEGPLPFTISDMGFARQIGHLRTFVASKLDLLHAAPAPEVVNKPNLCLSQPGRQYVVYGPVGGTIALDLSAAPGRFTAEWFNPRTGEYSAPLPVEGRSPFSVKTPDDNDWVLLVTKVK